MPSDYFYPSGGESSQQGASQSSAYTHLSLLSPDTARTTFDDSSPIRVQTPCNPMNIGQFFEIKTYDGVQYVMYSSMASREWSQWVSSTAKEPDTRTFRWKMQASKSDAYLNYHIAARLTDCTPKCICKVCGTILSHPRHKASAGSSTSTLTQHTKRCQDVKKDMDASNLDSFVSAQ